MKILKNSILSIAFFTLAFYLAEVLRRHTGDENNSSLIFIVAIVLVARFTDGYWYGIAASALSVFVVNYSFMYPFSHFTMRVEGYPVDGAERKTLQRAGKDKAGSRKRDDEGKSS